MIMGKCRNFTKLVTYLLIVAILFGSIGGDVVYSKTKTFSDSEKHWARESITRWLEEDIITGYVDGTFKPDSNITRAELVSIINRIFGFTQQSATQFSDIQESDWYAEDILIAKEKGYITGYDGNLFYPNSYITRQDAIVMIAKALQMQSHYITGDKSFTDVNEISQYALHSIQVFVEKGYAKGYPDGSFNPKGTITRGEISKVLDVVCNELYNVKGTYNDGIIEGNVIVNTTDVTLKDMTIEGNLYLTEGIGDGDVVLQNVNVKGITYVNGGGENSIKIYSGLYNNIVISKKINGNLGKVRVLLDDGVEVDSIDIYSQSKLETKEGIKIGSLVIDKKAEQAEISIDKDVQINHLEVNAKINFRIDENAKIKQVIINSEFELNGDNISDGSANKSLDKFFKEIKGSLEIKDTNSNSNDNSSSNNNSSSNDNDNSNNNEDIQEELWTLVWSDEFDTSEVDRTKWNYEIGNWIIDESGNPVAAGWGNNEKEYYTDSVNNSYIDDGKLIIKAIKEQTIDSLGTYDYTSARLLTRDLFSKRYGKFEAKIKLPEGSGLWPAFWLMPQDSVYGTWAASGEIDIMEAWGSDSSKVAGTIHYGQNWPNNEHSGAEYSFTTGDYTDFHTYSIEWEPGEIRWYVDGELYQTQNSWYSKGEDNAFNYSYPAPFDQEFYIILNLAVGGWFDGEPTEDTQFPAQMEVDYVRVYELTGREYRESIEPTIEAEPIPSEAKQADEYGNYIYDVTYANGFNEVKTGSDVLDKTYWNYVNLDQFGGNGIISTENIDGINYAKVDIISPGSQNYSHQLIQYVPMVKGRYYKVSFSAKAESTRNMQVKVGAEEDRGWEVYSGGQDIVLNDQIQDYIFIFQMDDETNINARLEINVGANSNSVWVGNVKLEEVSSSEASYDDDMLKEVLSDGNHIYNGTFDQGRADRMTFWHFNNNGTSAVGYVDEAAREFIVNNLDGTSNIKDVTLTQKGLVLLPSEEYQLTFSARAEEQRNIGITFTNKDGSVVYYDGEKNLTTDMVEYTITFTTPDVVDEQGQLAFNLGGSSKNIYLDDVKMIKLSNNNIKELSFDEIYLISNVTFDEGMDGWSKHVQGDYDGWGSSAIFSTENGELKIDIASEGVNFWDVILMNVDKPMYKDIEYILSFEARSTKDRKMKVALDNMSYESYFDNTVTLTSEMQEFSYDITLSKDDILSLKFLLGKLEGEVEIGAHEVYFDNVRLEIKDPAPYLDGIEIPEEPVEPEEPVDNGLIVTNGTFDADTNGWLTYTADGSDAEISSVNGELQVLFPNYAGWFTWSTQVYQDTVSLEAGKTYVLSFDARSTVDRGILVEMTDMEAKTVNLTSSNQTFSYEFTVTSATTAGKLNFLLGTENMDGALFTPNQSIYIDNISITEKEDISDSGNEGDTEGSGSIITNGTFDMDTNGWLIYTGDGSNAEIASTNGELQVLFPNYAGWFTWSTQVYQDTINIEAGKTYELSFDARSTVDRDMWVEMTDMEAKTVTLTTTSQAFTYEFTATSTTSTGKLNFLLGTENMDGALFTTNQCVYIDNINIIEKVSTGDSGDSSGTVTISNSDATVLEAENAINLINAQVVGGSLQNVTSPEPMLFDFIVNVESEGNYTITFTRKNTGTGIHFELKNEAGLIVTHDVGPNETWIDDTSVQFTLGVGEQTLTIFAAFGPDSIVEIDKITITPQP